MKQAKRYAIVCPGMGGTGAVANVALHHANQLSQDSTVYVLSDNFPAQIPAGTVQISLQPPGYQWLHRFGHIPREWHFARAARKALSNLAVSERLDAVLCHGHTVAALSAAPIKRQFGIPYALVTHGDIFDRPSGTYDPGLTWFYRRVTPRAYRQSDLIIALSPYMKELAARWAGPGTRLEVLPNGIDPYDIGLDTNSKENKDEAMPMLLYVGRLAPEKGVADLLTAFGEVQRAGIACELKIVGEGPLRPMLVEQVARQGLNSVTFLGARPRRNLGELYSNADMVCLPSISDPLPTVALEALMAGCPVVGTSAGGIPFIIEHEKTGLIVAAGDTQALAAAIIRLLKNSQMRLTMAECAAKAARKRFAWAEIGATLRSLLDELVQGVYCKTA